jgi:hypothetical protein
MVDIHDGDLLALPAPNTQPLGLRIQVDLLAGLEPAAGANDISVFHCDHFTIVPVIIQHFFPPFSISVQLLRLVSSSKINRHFSFFALRRSSAEAERPEGTTNI